MVTAEGYFKAKSLQEGVHCRAGQVEGSFPVIDLKEGQNHVLPAPRKFLSEDPHFCPQRLASDKELQLSQQPDKQ